MCLSVKSWGAGVAHLDPLNTSKEEDAKSGVDSSKGLIPLGLNPEGKDGFLFVPDSYVANVSAPLIILLHGARKSGKEGLESDFKKIMEIASDKGVILIAPDSRSDSWDVLRGGYGIDVAYIDAALDKVSEEYAIDTSHICLAGFSDGGTYSISLGVINGDFFTHVMAFSPGGIYPTRAVGKPKVFESHGTKDRIFPIDQTSRYIVSLIKRQRYDVTYVEFDGAHYVPDDIAQQAMNWFL